MDQIFGYDASTTSSNSTGISTTWTIYPTTNYPITVYPSNTAPSGIYTTSTTYSPPVLPDLKRCRSCNHAHIAGEQGCIDYSLGFQNSVVFVPCTCKEYLPKDNLEFLEYLSKKKESL